MTYDEMMAALLDDQKEIPGYPAQTVTGKPPESYPPFAVAGEAARELVRKPAPSDRIEGYPGASDARLSRPGGVPAGMVWTSTGFASATPPPHEGDTTKQTPPASEGRAKKPSYPTRNPAVDSAHGSYQGTAWHSTDNKSPYDAPKVFHPPRRRATNRPAPRKTETQPPGAAAVDERMFGIAPPQATSGGGMSAAGIEAATGYSPEEGATTPVAVADTGYDQGIPRQPTTTGSVPTSAEVGAPAEHPVGIPVALGRGAMSERPPVALPSYASYETGMRGVLDRASANVPAAMQAQQQAQLAGRQAGIAPAMQPPPVQWSQFPQMQPMPGPVAPPPPGAIGLADYMARRRNWFG